MSGRKEHEKYLKMLPQMGMSSPEAVPDDLRSQIYGMLGLEDPNKNAPSQAENLKTPAESKPDKKKATKLKDMATLKKVEEKRSKKR